MHLDFTTVKKRGSKNTITTNLDPQESETLNAVIYWRILNGYTTDKAHFLRQTIDFAMRNDHKAAFAMPTQREIDGIIEKLNREHEPQPQPTE